MQIFNPILNFLFIPSCSVLSMTSNRMLIPFHLQKFLLLHPAVNELYQIDNVDKLLKREKELPIEKL